MESTRVAVTGANSAVGKALLARLADDESLRVVAVVRRQAAAADLPRSPHMATVVIGYDQPDRLRAALDAVDAVVHLAGTLFESRTTRYRQANVDTTRVLVEAARAAAVRRLVLVSSLGADPHSANRYFRSKGEAERLVADAGIDAAIIRTPLLLGPHTAGGRALLRDASRPAVRLLGGGVHRLRPLDVDDLCEAVVRCCRESWDGVRTYELVGPTTVSQRELLQRTARLLGREPSIGSMPVRLARVAARLAGLVRTGGMTPTVIDVITSDEVVQRNADGDLGIDLTPLADTLAKLRPAAEGP